MKKGDGLVIAALAAIATGAGCASVWVLAAHGRLEAFFAGSLVLLGLAQMLAILRQRRQSSDVTARIDDLAVSSRQQAQKISDLSKQLDEIPAAAVSQRQSPADALVKEVNSLRSTLRNFGARRPEPASSRPPEPEPPHRPQAAPKDDGKAASGLERLELLLEPIVDLKAETTAHYRASLQLAAGNGRHVGFADLIAEAETNGLRASIDAFALARSIEVAQRLSVRRPGVSIFVPLGAGSLDNDGALEEIERLRSGARRSAAPIVFVISERDLAGLDSAGIEGLAGLARQGCTLALLLSQAGRPDLGALRELNVRYVLSPAALLQDRSSAAELVRSAGAAGFRVIVTDIAHPAQAEQARRFAQLGCGPHFAPPRLVRADLSGEERRASAA